MYPNDTAPTDVPISDVMSRGRTTGRRVDPRGMSATGLVVALVLASCGGDDDAAVSTDALRSDTVASVDRTDDDATLTEDAGTTPREGAPASAAADGAAADAVEPDPDSALDPAELEAEEEARKER